MTTRLVGRSRRPVCLGLNWCVGRSAGLRLAYQLAYSPHLRVASSIDNHITMTAVCSRWNQSSRWR